VINRGPAEYVCSYNSSLAALSAAVTGDARPVRTALQQLADVTGATAAAFPLTALQTGYDMPAADESVYTLILALCNKRQFSMQIPADEPQWSTDVVKTVFPRSLVSNANTSGCLHDPQGRCVHISSESEQWLRMLSALYNFSLIELLLAAGVLFDSTTVSLVGGLSWESLLAELDSSIGVLQLPLTRALLNGSKTVYLPHPSTLKQTQFRHNRVSSLCFERWLAKVPAAATLGVSGFNAAMRSRGHTCNLSSTVGDATWPGATPDAAVAQTAMDAFYSAVSMKAQIDLPVLVRQLTAPIAPTTLYKADAVAAAHRAATADALIEALREASAEAEPDLILHGHAPPSLGISGTLKLDSWGPKDDASFGHRRPPVGKNEPVMSLSAAITAMLVGLMSSAAPPGLVSHTTHCIISRPC
jgi:hypothetical protein